MLVRRSGVQSVFQFIPKVFSGAEVRALCRTLEFFHSNLHTPCLHGARFVHRGIVMLEQLPAVYKEVAWPMPVYLLVVFGCYSLATVGYRVATFNDCEDAARELRAQIQEAKEDLKKKGLKM
ncbi:hypothetical protein PDJAM_G00179970 [Pangasius djambal]|uniref:Uncharacterized protein n=1 Tax=Pangasius djambal TaxID=1691987 RepID=A0ACC5ZPM8_9TELE|nr:hypothetical protein [Pangasius djambal]